MKRALPFLLMILFVVPVLAKIEKAEITVKGMTCAHCSDVVTKALKDVQGVSAVQTSTQGVVTVEFESEKTTIAALESVIAKAGFDAGTTKATEPHKCNEKECNTAQPAGCCPNAQKTGCPGAKGGGCPSGKK